MGFQIASVTKLSSLCRTLIPCIHHGQGFFFSGRECGVSGSNSRAEVARTWRPVLAKATSSQRKDEMRLVGLTGGIASGKSTVSHQLESQGLPVVDADKVARVALDKNTWGWKRVVAVFGEGILRDDGEVDRKKLGEIIFNDPAKRGLLNRALQPCISLGLLFEVFKHWIQGTPVVIMDIPLLFEMKMNYLTSPVVVVWVDRATQEARLTRRDNSAIEQARARIASQLSLDRKRETADYIIDNSGALEDTLLQVDQLKKLLTAAPTWKELALSRFGVAAILTTAVALLLLRLR